MPKKQQRNAFYYFMIDKQQQLREQGKIVSLKDMPVIASAEWNKLSEAQKEQYKLRAKHEKAAGSSGITGAPLPRPGRLDNTGMPLSERVDTVAELEERRRKERDRLKLQWHGKDVIFLKFYFVAFQYLCDVEDAPAHLKYPPVEVALMEYSLKEGKHRTWHALVHPGRIPTGFRYQAKLHCEQTHEIPLEGVDKESVSDYQLLIDEMLKFVSPDQTCFPPLFVKKEHAYVAECCLQWLAYMAGLRENPFSEVYELNGLFMDLSAHIGGTGLSRFEVSDLLSTYKYDHDLGLRCKFHEELENNNCALGEVNKYCFVLSNSLCPLYKISLTNKHLPIQSNDSRCDSIQLKPSSTKQVSSLHGLATGEATTIQSLGKPQGVQGANSGNRYKFAGRGRGILVYSDDIRIPQGRSYLNTDT